VPKPGETPRGPHHHQGFEECIFVMAGKGCTEADSGEYPLQAGDTILIPPGENHVTRNTGKEPLVLLCFFPVADITQRTREQGA
jgi:quercetin dioxygenase-like cupin family protein